MWLISSPSPGRLSMNSTAVDEQRRLLVSALRRRDPVGAVAIIEEHVAELQTKREAEIYLASVELGKASGTYIDPSQSRLTIGSLGEAWLSAQAHLKPSSVAVMESAWRLHVKPSWDPVPVGEVRHSDIQEWVQDLAAGTSGRKGPTSATLVHRAYGVLSSILEIAVRDRRIRSNPARDVGLPRRVGRPHRMRRYTTGRSMRRAWNVDQGSGLHRTSLGRGDRAYQTGRGVREKTNHRRTERCLCQRADLVGTPKTHQQGEVPYPEFLAPALQALSADKDDDELLFPGPLGGCLETPTMRQRS